MSAFDPKQTFKKLGIQLELYARRLKLLRRISKSIYPAVRLAV
jgi:sulfur transfer protein SufE